MENKNNFRLSRILERLIQGSEAFSKLMENVKAEGQLTQEQRELIDKITANGKEVDEEIQEWHKEIKAEDDANKIKFEKDLETIGNHYENGKDALSALLHNTLDSPTERQKNYNRAFFALQGLRDQAATNLKNHLQG